MPSLGVTGVEMSGGVEWPLLSFEILVPAASEPVETAIGCSIKRDGSGTSARRPLVLVLSTE